MGVEDGGKGDKRIKLPTLRLIYDKHPLLYDERPHGPLIHSKAHCSNSGMP